MKLQFAFGNPSKKKGKSVANKRKTKKTKVEKASAMKRKKKTTKKSVVKKTVSKARKARPTRRKAKAKASSYNPRRSLIARKLRTLKRRMMPRRRRLGGLLRNPAISRMRPMRPLRMRPARLLRKNPSIKTMMENYRKMAIGPAKASLYKKMLHQKGIKVLEETKKTKTKTKGESVKKAKRKKAKKAKKTSKRTRKSKAKRTRKSKAKRVRRSKSRKSAKRAKRRGVKVVRVGKKKSGGRRRTKLSNPFRSMKMKKLIPAGLDKGMKAYLGHSGTEVVGLAIGGASVPFFNRALAKFLPGVASTISNAVGPQNAGAVIPILGGIIFNCIAEVGAVKKQKGLHDTLRVIGDGMSAAGVIGLAMGVSQQQILPRIGPVIGLAGMPYGMGIYPQLNGVEYFPMSGVEYFPMSGVNYTPAGGDANFGAANYGGDAGYHQSPADFGADWSQDSIAEHWGTEDDELSSAMN